MKNYSKNLEYKICVMIALSFFINIFFISNGFAHHVLGRPAYSLNEDSNTPPSMQIEIQIGEFFVTYMVYPAFPKPGEYGRLNMYISGIDNGNTFDGEVTFKVRDNLSMVEAWFKPLNEETLGVQQVYDGVFRQAFLFRESGAYMIRAEFENNNEPYIIDFPLQIGESRSMLPIGITIALIIFTLLTVNIFQRRRLLQAKIRSTREERIS